MISHFTPARLAAETGLAVAVIEAAVHSREIGHARSVGGQLLISDAAFNEWIGRQPQVASVEPTSLSPGAA